MNILFMMMVLIAISLASTLTITLSAYLKGNKEDKMFWILASSFMMSLALMFLLLDFREIYYGRDNVFLAYFSYSTLTVAVSLIVTSVGKLYDVQTFFPILGTIVFSITIGIVAGFATSNEDMLTRGFLLMFVVTLSMVVLLYNIHKAKTPMVKTVYFYQVLLIFLIMIGDGIRLGVSREIFDGYVVDEFDMIGTTFVLIILITMQIAFLSELNHIKLDQINQQNAALRMTMRDVRRMSETDTLTGLCNRRKVDLMLEEWMSRPDALFSVIMLDVNDLKEINDTFGHNAGDQVLIHIARVLDDNTRDTDVVGRWGGDEFIILLDRASEANARKVASNIRQVLKRDKFKPVEKHLMCSMGVSTYHSSMSQEELIDLADKRMYQDKEIYQTHKDELAQL